MIGVEVTDVLRVVAVVLSHTLLIGADGLLEVAHLSDGDRHAQRTVLAAAEERAQALQLTSVAGDVALHLVALILGAVLELAEIASYLISTSNHNVYYIIPSFIMNYGM